MRRFSRRKRKIKKALKKIKAIWIIKAILYGLGIYSFFYSIREYSTTLISFSTVVWIGIITGIIASVIIERQIKYYLFSIILLGSLCTALLFKINRRFVHSQENKLKVRILSKVIKSPKIEHSRVTIEYNDFTRDIEIDNLQEYHIESAEFIVLTVRKGGLGYNIITYRELVDK
jgi:hypothetical protein